MKIATDSRFVEIISLKICESIAMYFYKLFKSNLLTLF